jgi:flagellar assembly protein FliH
MSKVLKGEAGAPATTWTAPPVQEDAVEALRTAEQVTGHMLTAGRLQALQREAYDEAFRAGRADGLAQGQRELGERAQRLDQLLSRLSRPFADLDEQVVGQLIGLAFTLGRHIVRRELRSDPAAVVGVVREAIAALPVASRELTLSLHPEDALVVREAMGLADGEHRWHIREDPAIERGGCRLTTAVSQVDARVETRMKALFAAALGGDRASDGEP